MVTGDAMAKPLVEVLDEPGHGFDLSSLLAVVSSAALFSAPVKDEFFRHLPTSSSPMPSFLGEREQRD